jgi:hypothetical protein
MKYLTPDASRDLTMKHLTPDAFDLIKGVHHIMHQHDTYGDWQRKHSEGGKHETAAEKHIAAGLHVIHKYGGDHPAAKYHGVMADAHDHASSHDHDEAVLSYNKARQHWVAAHQATPGWNKDPELHGKATTAARRHKASTDRGY